MSKLKITLIEDDRPVRVTIELTAAVHRNLIAYGAALGHESGGDPVSPAKLIGPMLERFMAADRGFARTKRGER